jgi:hypothetical protein
MDAAGDEDAKHGATLGREADGVQMGVTNSTPSSFEAAYGGTSG